MSDDIPHTTEERISTDKLTPDSNPKNKEEVLDEVQRILNEPYIQAKKTHIWAEEVRGEHNWLAMTNFRDALDHMSKIYKNLEDGNLHKAREDLGEMEAHIKRAAYDSAQSATEKELEETYDARLPASIYKIALLDHMSDSEFHKREDKVANKMRKGRNAKANSLEKSIKKFRSAYEHAKKMKRGTPSRKQVILHFAIIFGVILSIISFSVSAVLVL